MLDLQELKRKGKAKAQKPAERRRVEDIYQMAANHIVTAVKEAEASVVVMEKLKNIREKKKRIKAMNGRLNRWSFRK
jgi:IS605 OrfB family transposase